MTPSPIPPSKPTTNKQTDSKLKKSLVNENTSEESNVILYFVTAVIAIGAAGVIIVGKKNQS